MSGWVLPLLLALFFFSGACALVYQVMWLRMLALVFGVTVYAASTVLASFMAGLALGSFTAGRIAVRLRSPLGAFGLLEIGVGVTAFATPILLEIIKGVWVAVYPSLPESLALVTVARFAAAFAVLIVPTTLMGATLPIVMQSALVQERALGSRIGLLYAINTTGAIAGALIAGFYFVSDVGMAVSFRIAAATNVAIGIIAIAASYAHGGADTPARQPISSSGGAVAPPEPVVALDGAAEAAAPQSPDRALRAVLWTFALSGALSLALEIVWFRMLVIFLRPTAYAFTIMLAAVLAGIALGSAIATPLLARLTRRRADQAGSGAGDNGLAVLTVVQLAISVAAVLSFNALASLQPLTERFAPSLERLGLDPYLAPIIVASLLAMLPTTLLLGFAFPIGLSLWAGHGPDAARRIGTFYSLNVFGAIAGSVLGGFLMLPLLGSRGSLIAAAALAMASSVMLCLPQWPRRPNFAGFMAVVGPILFAMCALNARDPFAIAAERLHRGERMLWREEGVQTTVAVHDRGEGRQKLRILYLDGMHQSDDLPSTAFVHHRIGALPVMLHAAPRNVLVVGLGGGATPGAAATFPGVQVDVVELSSAVVDGSAFFTHINFGLLERPNVRLRVDDGRNFVLTTRKKYDVVTADIILPRHAGAGALYAREYFELVRSVLAEDGLALQWNGALTDTPYKMIMRTFMQVFPHTTLWGDGSLMVGSLKPFTLSQRAYEERRSNPEFRKVFDWDLEMLRRNYVGGPAELARWVGEGPILTDDKPLVEYFLALPKDDPEPDMRGLQGRFTDILRP